MNRKEQSSCAWVLVLTFLVQGVSHADLALSRSRAWQDLPDSGLGGSVSAHDNFGLALVAGDFDGDGRDDLAAFDREDGGSPNAGAVRIQLGSEEGLSPVGLLVVDFWPGVLVGDAEAGDEFGIALAAGDFDGDGFDDIAIGIPGEDAVLAPPPIAVETLNCGAVLVLYGSLAGLSTDGIKILPFFSGDMTSARFGAALAVGDFDADGYEDLAVGAPTAEVSGQEQAGFVAVYRGGVAGLATTARWLHQDASDATGAVSDVAEPADLFGYSLVAGNFNGDLSGPNGPPIMDLAIGAPGEDSSLSGTEASGLVHLFYGSSFGTPLGFNSDQTLEQSAVSSSETLESGDNFGFELAAGDFDGDGYDDLAIAAPHQDRWVEDVLVDAAGLVSIQRGGSPFVLSDGSGPTLDQSVLGPEGLPAEFDFFGFAMYAADFDRDGLDDLVVAAPFDDLADPFGPKGMRFDAGSALLIAGSTPLFPSAGQPPRQLAQHWDGQVGETANFENYGMGLTGGDFDGDGHLDLAVGAPGEAAQVGDETLAAVGAIFELPGALFCDGLDRGLPERWSQLVP